MMFLVGGFFMLRSSPSLALVFVVTVPILVLSLVNSPASTTVLHMRFSR